MIIISFAIMVAIELIMCPHTLRLIFGPRAKTCLKAACAVGDGIREAKIVLNAPQYIHSIAVVLDVDMMRWWWNRGIN